MVKYVVFLRGINVGGRKIIRMEDLRRVFESLGFANVKTYIQSGNVIFDARLKNLTTLKTNVENELKKAFGHEVNVMPIAFSDLTSMVKQDPFKQIETGKDAMLFATFLSSEPTSTARLPLTSTKENLEVIDVRGRAAFTVARRKKDGRCGFPNDFIEKQLGVAGTSRNWSTVKKIVELVETTKEVLPQKGKGAKKEH